MFRERKTAFLIATAVVVIATLAGVYKSLARLSREVDELFYNGVYLEDARYLEPSINSHLQNSARSALNAGTLLKTYPLLSGEAEALLEARRKLLDATGVAEKYDCDRQMTDAFNVLLKTAMMVDIAENDLKIISEDYLATYRGAHTKMAESKGFHAAVGKMRNDTSAITIALSAILPVSPPKDVFAEFGALIQFP
ncbi:MAG: hypothetical protein FWG48_01410 [Oscillospiraceae bacterium]|nr:hypothetical protein [Oscillospiraceae bacterium]